MGLFASTLVSASKALNPIMAGARQASSYVAPLARSARRLSSGITKDALSHGMSYYALGGAALGGVAGGYNAYENGTGVTRGAIGGAVSGAVGGAALRMGMSAYGVRGGRAAQAFGMRMRGGLSGAESLRAGSRNAFTPMKNAFLEAKVGARINMMGSPGLGSYLGSKASPMVPRALHMYGRGVNAAATAGRRLESFSSKIGYNSAINSAIDRIKAMGR